MNRVVHFEIHAGEPERAAKFCQEVFGWEVNEFLVPGVEVPEENRYWLVTTGPDGEAGINGGILPRRGPAPADGQAVNGFVCTVEVASCDDYLDRVAKAGGRVAVPKMRIEGVGWSAYCVDTEGNIFGLMESDPASG